MIEIRGTYLFTDREGNRYYTTDEACDILAIKYPAFRKRLIKHGIVAHRRPLHKERYYLVEDIEQLKNEDIDIYPLAPRKGT